MKIVGKPVEKLKGGRVEGMSTWFVVWISCDDRLTVAESPEASHYSKRMKLIKLA